MPAVLEERSTTTFLARNIAALQRCSRAAADLIQRTEPRADANFLLTQDADALGEPVLTATIPGPGGPVLLASRRRPLDEARRLAETIDLEKAGGVVVMGFGVGHHVAEIARRMQRTGVVFVFEPDVALLRAVLERIDHSNWLSRANVVILTDPDEAAAVHAATRGAEGLLALGVKVVEHPASLSRLAPAGAARFRRHVADAVNAVKTAVVTTLVQSDVTFRNMLMNLGPYVTRPGIEDLRNAAPGRPAIIVAAGPSLRRNLDRLADPAVRERFVIIAVQTVLKPMLARGIRPHFVTAIDYHEISRRFYEGLTARDVEGITLVATPAANPAILDSFPGAIRMTSDRDPGDPNPGVLDTLLTPALAGHKGQLPLAATVAHMGYYLARFLGCDPAILVGLDLGFTDGQYYAAGAAIHDVWAPELNAFNSLERMEHERIVRNRRSLKRAADVLGRPVYTDEQMATYLAQFGRDFLADAARGLTIVDATEGGVAKPHTVVLPLADAIDRYTPAAPHALPPAPDASAQDPGRIRAAQERLCEVRREVWRFGQISGQTRALLTEMLGHHGDQQHVNRLITRVHEHRDSVRMLPVAPRLVERLNQVGVLKRVRADRDLELAATLAPMERQRRQIERDITNTEWLADAAEHFGAMLDDAVRVLEGAPKTTRDPAPASTDAATVTSSTPTIAAVIPLPLGADRLAALSRPFVGGRTPLQHTLARLLRCRRLGRVVVLTDDPDAARRLIGSPPARLRIDIVGVEAASLLDRPAALRPARLWAGACWRGGLAHATIFDELLAPAAMVRALDQLGIDAAVVVGPDWVLVDPALTDALIERHAEAPQRHTLTFTQAAPGLAPCVVARSLLDELARAAEGSGPFATIGGLLGYIPIAPRPDPIAGPTCVHVAPIVRDLHARCIPDSPGAWSRLEAALAPLGESLLDASAERIAEVIGAHDPLIAAPSELVLELCTGRRTAGPRAATHRGAIDPPERAPIQLDTAERLIAELARARPDAVVTLSGAGDPLLHPELPRVIAMAKSRLAGVHVRTDLLADRGSIDALLGAAPDVISVDLMAETPETYRAVMGADAYATARASLDHLLASRGKVGGIPIPWVVPRLTRCDRVYAELEPFVDRWIMHAGAAAVDPLPEPVRGERIEPLPIPARAAARLWSSRMLVLCDGRVPASELDLAADRAIGDAAREGLLPVWRRLLAHRRRLARESPGHADLWTGI